ncbi:MAG: phage resistance protein [Gemmataceae bacterium]
MPEPLIGDLLELPDRVHKGDFVLNLSAGVTNENAARTLAEYVVTPQLADSLDNALNFVRSAVDGKASKAAYLHGSFGAGKSHFMAVLNLLLAGHTEARRRAELQPVLAKHQRVEGKKFLLVPYHLIGARDLESAVLGGYVEHVRRHHPTAPLPGVYLAEGIFANAVSHRRSLGDEKFFATLNRSLGSADDEGWGTMDAGWDARTFDAALAAPPGHETRVRLVGDLVQNVFPAFEGVAAAGRDEAYVSLDQGLSVLSRHAKGLGYDALILFLDELILWLASHAADVPFLHREGQKLAKLVESQTADRPVPVVSFVARQRDLRELVGETVTGSQQVNFSDALRHWEGRFHVITLEDRNLPAIAERRVLRPKSPAAKDQIDRAFAATLKMRQQARDVLMTADASEAEFRKVYPFSPAPVETLVAVSTALQRERTALKIMLQLLVEKKGQLRLGELVPVGDLWDAVAHGEEAFSDVLRKRFDDARKLYHQKLRPILEEEFRQSGAGRGTPHAVAPDGAAPVALADDRILKTLLLAALVPEVPALKALTPDRLAALNYGSIKAMVPGQEGAKVLEKLRRWASREGSIRLTSPDSPTTEVAVQVSGVDTDSIVEKARGFDSTGSQQRLVRDMVMQALNLGDPNAIWHAYPFVWRGTRRDVEVAFANVREAAESLFDGPADGWRVVIDWPFDEPGHDRTEDVDRLARLQAGGKHRQVLVWNPLFFSRKTRHDLGRLTILNQLLKEEMFQQYAAHLGLQDRATARGILESQRSALTNTVRLAVEAAYGVRPAGEGQLDAAHDGQETRLWSLSPLFTPQPPVGATLSDALEHLAGQALAAEFPAHPNFDPDGRRKPVGRTDLGKVWDVVQAAWQHPDRYTPVDRALRPLVRQVVEPLRLGTMAEDRFVLGDEWRAHLEKCREAAGLDAPTVERVRGWLDLPLRRGLPDEVGNLVVLTYALQTNRTFYLNGVPESPGVERLHPHLELRPQPLPSADEWAAARDRAEHVLGLGRHPELLTGANLALLDRAVRERAGELAAGAAKLPDRLEAAAARLHVPADRPRLATARLGERLVRAVQSAPGPKALAQALARAEVGPAPATLFRSLTTAAAVADRLGRVNWDSLDGLDRLPDPRGREILDGVREAVGDDEFARPLVNALDDAEHQAVRLLRDLVKRPPLPPAPPAVPMPTVPPPAPQFRAVETRSDVTASAADFDRVAAGLAARLREGDGRRVRLSWVIEEEVR